MKYGKHLRLSAALALSTLLAGCVTTAISNDVPECDKLVPQLLLEPVEGVDPDPTMLGAIDAWREAWLGTQYALAKANERPGAVQHITSTCLKLHREALARSRKGVLGRLFN